LSWNSPARRLRDAVEPIATITFWAEPVHHEYEALGLDFLQGYVYSRGCVLGEPAAAVVAAALICEMTPATLQPPSLCARCKSPSLSLATMPSNRDSAASTSLAASAGLPISRG
ncbi:MAG: helix-turn-helix domain-containing protein, partial [Sciscionella sp.]